MANVDVWDDGRSGAAGCTAGNIALRALSSLEPPVRKIKGTVFETGRHLLVGRVCSNDSYLSEPVLHWANASWDQHCEMAREAQALHKKFAYLFITASKQPASVQTWVVPGEIVEAVFVARGRNHRGESCAIHIISDDKRHRIGDRDITKLHSILTLSPAEVERLVGAYQARPPRVSGKNRGASARLPAELVQGAASYDIPVSGARAVRVQLPGPLSPSDVSRVKQWLDLAAEVLTEGYDESQELSQRRWLAQQVQTGLDELARGEHVDGEEAFARVLSRARSAQEASR